MTEWYKLHPYIAPTWAKDVHNQPSHYVKLSNLNTPIHSWNLPDTPPGYEISIKRDDLSGTELSGNKVRCLQLIMAEAILSGAKHVVTGGGPQSGHCRATSLVCRYLGLQPHVVIEGAEKVEDIGAKGNSLLYRLAGSQIYLAPYENFTAFQNRVKVMQTYISEKYGVPCYRIPIGGSVTKGVFGFIDLFQELIDQGLHDQFDDIVLAIATGGTTIGLALANYLTGSKLKVHAVTISLAKEELGRNMKALLTDLGAGQLDPLEIVDIIEGYVGERYGTATDQVLEYITRISAATGILCDPYYTAKAALGLSSELHKNPSRFKGKRILFIHTGGIFGLFNGEMDRVVDRAGISTNNIQPWPDATVSPV